MYITDLWPITHIMENILIVKFTNRIPNIYSTGNIMSNHHIGNNEAAGRENVPIF